MANWQTLSLGEIAEVFDGPHATPKTVDIGPIFLGIGALDNGRINLGETRHVTAEDFAIWTRRVKPRAGDVVFSYETRLGQAAMIPSNFECCLGRRMGLLRVKPDKADPHFLLYSYISPQFQQLLRSRTVPGATVDRLPLKDFSGFPIAVPPMEVQRSISSLLGALDDKIEVNRRMNETLEAMAQAIFRDWFVDFGPVRRKLYGATDPVEIMGGLTTEPARAAALAALFPDVLGEDELPAGWKVDRLGSFADLQNGYAFKSSDWSGNGVPVIKIGSVKPGFVDLSSASFISHALAKERASFRLSSGDMVVGLTGYVGETGRVPIVANLPLLNQRVARFRPKPGTSAAVFTAVRDVAFKIFAKSKAHGSAQPNVSTKDLLTFPVVFGSAPILAEFERVVGPMFARSLSGLQESSFLAETRDYLLPRLMFGEVRVGDVAWEATK